MKLTASQLRRIIKEEVENARPSGDDNLIEKLRELVKQAYYEGRSDAPQDYYFASPMQRDEDFGWRNSNARSELDELLGEPK